VFSLTLNVLSLIMALILFKIVSGKNKEISSLKEEIYSYKREIQDLKIINQSVAKSSIVPESRKASIHASSSPNTKIPNRVNGHIEKKSVKTYDIDPVQTAIVLGDDTHKTSHSNSQHHNSHSNHSSHSSHDHNSHSYSDNGSYDSGSCGGDYGGCGCD